jgi:peptide/nickel transport system permease protein
VALAPASRSAGRGASPLRRFAFRRLAFGCLTLLIVSVVVFGATQVLPGDAARAALGRMATPERLHALQLQLHLDRPVVTQYVLWLKGVLTGEPGTSMASGKPVLDMVAPRAGASAVLVLLASVIGIPLSLGLGIWAALRRSRAVDVTLSVASLALAALPEFVIGIGLILLLATNLFHWLPPVSMVAPGASVLSHPVILVLPAITLCLLVFPYIFRMMRSAMVDVLASEYMEMAKLKGLSPARLIFRHALPNALAPAVQVVALNLAYLAGGIVVVEYVFGYPGIGQCLMQSIVARDIPAIQLIVLGLAAIYVLLNMTADLVALLLTPRLRTAQWQSE